MSGVEVRWSLDAATLVDKTRERAAHAVRTGALEPIATACETVDAQRIPFQVRQATNLVRKQKITKQRPPDFDPFLPYEQDLYVGDAGPDHAVLFNKFNVLDDHLLIVTRKFEHQDLPLNAADFAALAHCWRGTDGLAFYNCGAISGASQRHKHLQLVPRLGPSPMRAPVEAVLDPAQGRVPAFEFVHGVAALHLDGMSVAEAGTAMAAVYEQLTADTSARGGPYNLLATRRWMMVVPRAAEHSGRTSINALGFAGSLFVRDAAELEDVRRRGPLRVLADVTRPRT